MYVLQVIAHCFLVKLLFVLYFVSITTHEDVAERFFKDHSEKSNDVTLDSKFHQKIIISPCPENFQISNDYCIHIMHGTAYPPDCPFEETAIFNDYIHQIHTVDSMWMPVKRDRRMNGIGLFYWMEPTSSYKSLFEPCKDKPCVFLNENNPENDCVVYHNSTAIEAVPCSRKTSGMCVYNHLQKKPKSFCSQSLSSACRQSDFSTKSKCFCQLSEANLEKAEFLIPYQNLVYHSMTDEMCYIGLKNTGTSFIWTSSKLPVNYAYWSSDTYPSFDNNTFGAISSDGWTLRETDRELNCTLYQQDIPKTSSPDDMFLDFDESAGTFILKLTESTNWLQNNGSTVPLVFCFSDASAESILDKIETMYKEETGGFWFKPISNEPGNYWCEAFLYPELKVKKSNEYLLKKDMEEYVVILNFTYESGSSPLSQSSQKNYKQLVDHVLDQPRETFTTRIFTIVRLDEALSQITINFHVSTDKSAADAPNFGVLRSILHMSTKHFTFINMLSVNSCMGMQVTHNGRSVTWPLTVMGEVAEKPIEGWCVDGDGYILKRACEGNYVDGAQWAEFQGTCTIVSSTNTTQNLTSIVDSKNPNKYLQQIVELTKNPTYFNPNDVALVSEFLGQLSEVATTNIALVSEIVNNLGTLNPDILRESQLIYNATDEILHYVADIVRMSSNTDTILGRTLTVASFMNANINTLQLMKDPDPIEVQFSIVSRPEVVKKDEHFDSALFLHDSLSRSYSSTVKVLIYNNPVFFGEENTNDLTRTIYRVISESDEVSRKVSIIYRNDFNSSSIIFHRCSTWNYSSNKSTGHWVYQRKAEQYIDNIICNFDGWGYSRLNSIQFGGDTTITSELLRISNVTSSQCSKLEETRDLLRFRSLVEPTDLDHIARILNQVESVEAHEFSLIADIIDGVLDLKRTILLGYESLHRAPELILENLSRLMKNYSRGIDIARKNFLLLVSYINETGNMEIDIPTCSEFCTTATASDTNPSDLPSEEVELSVILNTELVKQVRELKDPKVMLTVFNDDGLFLSKDTSQRNSSKIIGIEFPDFEKALNGDIQIRYRTNKAMFNKSCALWQQTYWVPDEAPIGMRGQYSKCSYWHEGYFSLRFDIMNITAFIEEQLKIEDLTLMLKNIEEVLVKYHHLFTAYDINLVTNIIEEVLTLGEDILTIICRIVSVITKMNRDILAESQENYQSTNRILDRLDKLARMLEMNKFYYYYDTQLLLMTSPVQDNAIVGVMISNCENECTVDKVFGDEKEVKIPDEFNMTSIRLSEDLFERLKTSMSYPKLIILAFHGDALFNSKNPIGHNGWIFGTRILGYQSVSENDIILYTKKLTGGYCTRWQVYDGSKVGTWEVEGKMNESVCKFQQQGFLSYMNNDINTNITKALESILQSNSPNIDQLQEIKGISFLYDKFKSIDVSLLLQILLKIIDNNVINRIESIELILQNLFSIPIDVLTQSQVDHNALSDVLTLINSIGHYLPLNTSYGIKDQFSIVVCSACTGISAVFDKNLNIWCAGDIDEDHFGKISNFFPAFDQNIHSKCIFTVFHGNTLFVQQEAYDSSVVLGLNIVNDHDESTSNEAQISILGAEYNHKIYTCAYWEHEANSYGVWRPVKTDVDGSFTTCSFPRGEYFTLVKNIGPTNITEELLRINASSDSYSERIQNTLDIIHEYEHSLEALHVSIISSILGTYDDVIDDLTLIGNITDSLMNINRTVLVQSQLLYNATHEILDHVDTLVTKHMKDTNLRFSNFALLIQSNFSELSFENCETACAIRIISLESGYSKNIDAFLSIDQGLEEYLVEHSLKIYITIYFNDVLFNEGITHSAKNVGIIAGVAIPGIKDSNWKGSVRFGYKYSPNRADICAYWNWNYQALNGSLIQRGHWEVTPANLDSMWSCENKLESTHFTVLEIADNVTRYLQSILNSDFPIEEQLDRVNVIIITNSNSLSPMDIYLIAKILGKVTGYEETTHKLVFYVSKIISNLCKVDRATLRKSQKLYLATDTILYSLDQIMLKRQAIENVSDLITETNFSVITYKLSNTDIRGFRLEGCKNTSCDFTTLHKDMDTIDTVDDKIFKTALILSKDLLQQIGESENPIYLIVTIFFDDVFFNELSRTNYSTSVILGVLLRGLNDSLRGNVSLVYTAHPEELYDSNSCAYWDYKIQEKNGFWREEAVPRNENQTMVCDYAHITHFVLLLASSEGVYMEINGSKTLDIITNINSILSLLGIFGILLTALMFDRWRNNTGNQILIHFSFAISIKNVMLYISVGVWDETGGSSMACTITGGILHYSILSEFAWMLIIAVLQFKRFVEVLGSPTKYIMLKACICGWAFPAIPVFLIIIIDVNNYSAGRLGLCYPSGLGLYLGIWLPLVVIICVNTVIFIIIIYNVFHKKTESREQVNHEILFQWRLALLLFFMLGLTWLFGFLSLSGEYLFMIVFCFCATLQGFVMFMFFIVFNKSTRMLYIQTFRLWLYSNGYRSKFI